MACDPGRRSNARHHTSRAMHTKVSATAPEDFLAADRSLVPIERAHLVPHPDRQTTQIQHGPLPTPFRYSLSPFPSPARIEPKNRTIIHHQRELSSDRIILTRKELLNHLLCTLPLAPFPFTMMLSTQYLEHERPIPAVPANLPFLVTCSLTPPRNADCDATFE